MKLNVRKQIANKQVMTICVVLFCSWLLYPSLVVGQSPERQTFERPTPLNATIPAYPPMARAKRISGVVLVDVSVNAEGKVIEAVAVMGGEYLRESARKAALGWRFKPLPSAPGVDSSADNYTVRLTFIFHEYSYKPPDKKPDFKCPYQIEVPYP